jgi:crossover junction endodeoxyribonuclease RuvC
MAHWYLGIDPGLSGAVALINPGGSVEWTEDTPTYEKGGGAKGRELDLEGMRLILDTASMALGFGDQLTVVIEDIPIRTTDQISALSTSKLARSQAYWEGMVIGMRLGALERVAPQRWKREMNIPARSEKGVSRQKAMALFPDAQRLFARVKDDGRAEAALIAEWGRRLHGRGTNPA